MEKKLLTEWSPISFTSDMLKESKELNDGKIILKGPIQKSNTLNQNGRIYPRPILEREILNYQKLIQENRAMENVITLTLVSLSLKTFLMLSKKLICKVILFMEQ